MKSKGTPHYYAGALTEDEVNKQQQEERDLMKQGTGRKSKKGGNKKQAVDEVEVDKNTCQGCGDSYHNDD